VDIIGLAGVNNEHGILVGDLVLRGVGQALVAGLAPRRVFRVGGDNFLVEIPEPLDHVAAESLANEIERLTSQPLPGVPVRIACRIGITLLRNNGDENLVVRSANDALWQAVIDDARSRVFGLDDHVVHPEPTPSSDPPPSPGKFVVGDRVFVLRWLLQGTREGPFPIVEASGPGRYVVAYGSMASHVADAAEHDLILATPAVIDALPSLLREREASRNEADAQFAARLRGISRSPPPDHDSPDDAGLS
jgi:hypothetical protein